MAADRQFPPQERVVSVVIIARNEERTIHACISAAIDSLSLAIGDNLADRGEVILVDSDSKDRTVEKAKSLPITILQLSEHQSPSAAAGRQMGLEHSRGNILFFIDGDVVVEKEWLGRALELLNLPSVAGVAGSIVEVGRRGSVLSGRIHESEVRATPDATFADTEVVNTGLYRREILETVGGFHPYLKGAEDLDVGFRIAAHGWRLIKTKEILGHHNWSDTGEELSYVEYLHSVAWWSYGSGQALRFAFWDRDLRKRYLSRYLNARFLIEYLRALTVIAFVTVQLMILLPASWASTLLLVVDMALAAAAVWHLLTRKRPLREVLFDFEGIPYSIIRHAALVLGFALRIPEPASYARDTRELQTGVTFRRANHLAISGDNPPGPHSQGK